MAKKAVLLLKNGRVFYGENFGAEGETSGEVVFNTSMFGYQEIVTDPSYCGQIVTMTYTQIGNVGVNEEDVESLKPWIKGFIVKEYFDYPSNFRCRETFASYLKKHRIVGISGIDTRALTKCLRDEGSQNGIISTSDFEVESLKLKLSAVPDMNGLDLVKDVSSDKVYGWKERLWRLGVGYKDNNIEKRFNVAAYDYGIKYNILRNLIDAGCNVTVVPAAYSAYDVLKLNPDGIFLSNGPGDPEPVSYAIENIRKLLEKKPVFGICLGHQLLALALGGKTYKLKFGHRGANQPVMDLTTGKVEITSQNHGFAVDLDSMPDDVEVTHINLNDRTVEGLRHKKLSLFSVQYHPEASPGPHDASYLFKRFTDLMGENR